MSICSDISENTHIISMAAICVINIRLLKHSDEVSTTWDLGLIVKMSLQNGHLRKVFRKDINIQGHRFTISGTVQEK